jgi:scyllo-inositol 2-dehydrogenase (NAD+)
LINVAMLSRWHVHADDYAREATTNELLKITMVWDEDPERGRAWADELGVPFEANLESVLADPTIQAVIVDTPTNLHETVIIKAAQAGKHIFTEKVLATTTVACERIFAAVEEAGVKLMVSLPRLTESYTLFAEKVVEEGWLGRLTTARCRVSHDGAVPSEGRPNGWLPDHFYQLEPCGGGALIDLGAHPIYLLNRLCGPAESVSARFNYVTGKEVEDHAVVIVDFKNGAMGSMETGFINYGMPFQLELSGTDGTLLIENTIIRLKSRQFGESGWWTPENGLNGTEIVVPEALPTPMEQWVDSILHNKETTITKTDILGLTRINEAARESHETGKRQFI